MRRLRQQFGFRHNRGHRFPAGVEGIGSQIERGARQQSRLLGIIDQRGEKRKEPRGKRPAGCPRFGRLDRCRPIVAPIEQRRKPGVLARHCHKGRPRIGRSFAKTANHAPRKIAHRTPVFRSGIAAFSKKALRDSIGRRPAVAGGDYDLVDQLDSRLQACGWGQIFACSEIDRSPELVGGRSSAVELRR
jgi:hypothetical protein